MANDTIGTIALVWRGTREMREAAHAQKGRLGPLFDAMTEAGLAAEPAVYLDEMIDDVRKQLLRVDGVLVWVDPVAEGGDRSQLDPLLREVASHGVWVSTHPDVILKMGTKQVLVDTKSVGWGTDCYAYETAQQLQEQLPMRLASGATRVLKQYRGNGGIGVYRVALAQSAAGTAGSLTPGLDAIVHTQHARAGSAPKDIKCSTSNLPSISDIVRGANENEITLPGSKLAWPRFNLRALEPDR